MVKRAEFQPAIHYMCDFHGLPLPFCSQYLCLFIYLFIFLLNTFNVSFYKKRETVT